MHAQKLPCLPADWMERRRMGRGRPAPTHTMSIGTHSIGKKSLVLDRRGAAGWRAPYGLVLVSPRGGPRIVWKKNRKPGNSIRSGCSVVPTVGGFDRSSIIWAGNAFGGISRVWFGFGLVRSDRSIQPKSVDRNKMGKINIVGMLALLDQLIDPSIDRTKRAARPST